ncbi:hypothetical protein BJX76DRAFT_21264 [Aspergillus varians]
MKFNWLAQLQRTLIRKWLLTRNSMKLYFRNFFLQSLELMLLSNGLGGHVFRVTLMRALRKAGMSCVHDQVESGWMVGLTNWADHVGRLIASLSSQYSVQSKPTGFPFHPFTKFISLSSQRNAKIKHLGNQRRFHVAVACFHSRPVAASLPAPRCQPFQRRRVGARTTNNICFCLPNRVIWSHGRS